KNTAPAIVLSELAVYALARVRFRNVAKPTIQAVTAPALLVATALISMWVTRARDTSIGLNTANNVMQRGLGDDRKMSHFHARHGMPAGADVAELRGRNVLAKLDGRRLFRVNDRTNNYELMPGGDALLSWVSERGFGEYWTHLIFHEPRATFA